MGAADWTLTRLGVTKTELNHYESINPAAFAYHKQKRLVLNAQTATHQSQT